MSARKIIVVFGATGKQGGSVINSILTDPAMAAIWEVHGVTRDPSKPVATSLSEKGVKMLKADLDSTESLRAALQGAYAVFALTNWQEIMNKEREIQQGKNIADVSKERDVQHLIWSGNGSVEKLSNGKFTKVHHFDGKAAVEDYIRTIGIPATFIHPAVFMHEVPLYLEPSSANAQSYILKYPGSTSTKIPLISIQKDLGIYVKAILQKREQFLGKRICAAENEYSIDEIVSILKNNAGLDVKPADGYTFDDLKHRLASLGLPEFWQEDLAEMMQFIEEFGYYGGSKIDNGSDMLGEPLETFAEWLKKSPEIVALK